MNALNRSNNQTMDLKLSLFLILSSICIISYSQFQNYNEQIYYGKLDSLRIFNQNSVSPSGDKLELAVNIALTHYPELSGHQIKIKYRKNVAHPITAGYSAANIIRFRKKHIYRLILSPSSFVKYLSLNKQVAVIGHEMAHFVYYKERPAIGMAIWGIRYLTSKKFRYSFEKEADRMAIDHGLGGQLLQLSMYMSNHEVKQYIHSKMRSASGK